MSLSVPPTADEFEVSIVGPGRGESVVVHLGDNEWCVVDSCIPRGSHESAALSYLKSFGNGAESRVKLIVATHWHDDHIRGLSSIVRQVPDALFACSAALDKDNFFTLVEASSRAVQGRSGVDEFASIFELLRERASCATERELVAPAFAIANRRLLHLVGDTRRFAASVTALSPSDGTVKLAFTDIARWLPRVGESQRRITNVTPNSTSVALWLEVGTRRALLGADLEHTDRTGEGWIAVLAGHQALEPAAIFKVPHHGSAGSDFPTVWSKILIDRPVAVVTPFVGGTTILPKERDLRRLANRTDKLYCTSERPGQLPRRDQLVEKTARRILAERRVIEGQPGHVRVRWSLSDERAAPVIESFNGAYHVNSTLAA